MIKLAPILAAAAILAAVALTLPDIKRYLKIRSM